MSGQPSWERGQAGSSKLGWWAQGEGFKWPPPVWAPAQKGHETLLRPMGAQGPPHLPELPAGPAACCCPVQEVLWGCEVGSLYLGLSDSLGSFPCSCKEPKDSCAWPRWVTLATQLRVSSGLMLVLSEDPHCSFPLASWGMEAAPSLPLTGPRPAWAGASNTAGQASPLSRLAPWQGLDSQTLPPGPVAAARGLWGQAALP